MTDESVLRMKMSNERHETVADIVDEMRETCNNPTLGIKTDREKRLEKFLKDIIIEYADRIEAAAKHENAELRKCLKEAIREKCPFTRMSCKHGDPCDYECGTFKWRKALKGASND